MTQTPDSMPTWESWVRLHMTPGVGPQAVRRLLQQAGSPEAALACVREAGGAGLRHAQTHALAQPPIVVHGLPAGTPGTIAIPGSDAAVWNGEHAVEFIGDLNLG